MASIKKRPDGRWRARYRDESGREHAKHFARKTDAQTWLDQVTAAVVTGQYADPRAGRVKLQVFYDRWAPTQLWTPGTRKAMDLALSSSGLGDRPIGRIRPSAIETWVKTMAAKPLEPGTIRTRTNNLSAVFRAAVKDKVIPANPCDDVRLPRRRKAEAAMRIPTTAEVGKLLKAATPEFRPFIAVCAFAGLRLGEAAALKVADVDFLKRVIHVERQVQRAGGTEVEIRPPKYGSERDVFAPAGLTEILARHVELTGCADWLFTGTDGKLPPHQNTIGHRWRTARKAAGLDEVKLHDLRHYFASGLIAAGCDVVTVQRALGHRSATVTLSTYSHLWPTAEDRTRKAAEAMLAEAMPILADSVRTGGGG
jgi:integrase